LSSLGASNSSSERPPDQEFIHHMDELKANARLLRSLLPWILLAFFILLLLVGTKTIELPIAVVTACCVITLAFVTLFGKYLRAVCNRLGRGRR
jgi:hypothetical protein